MADPARTPKLPWEEIRQRDVRSCVQEACYPVKVMLATEYTTIPPCRICVHETKLRKLAEERGQ